ncbi:MAG TPA: tetratricopeptide repeat protein [Steroidobacteraceae bacterium]|nr:tetratricopeptide repeat protein [Steroidobacteraceae bacterium]
MAEVGAPKRHEVGLNEAMAIALKFQKEGHLDAAEKIYRQVLEHLPGHVDATHYLGLIAFEAGDLAAAERIIGYAIAAAPQHADAHSNLGLVLRAQERLADAEAAFRRAIALNPAHANAYSNLGMVLRALERPEEAEQTYRSAIKANPEHAEAHHNLGALLAATGRVKEAVYEFSVATTLDPAHRQVWRSLAHAYHRIGDRPNAVRVAREWLARDPADPVAQHTLAAVSGEDVPPRAADAYVERVFDDFAESFDSRLGSLGYRAPALTAKLLELVRGPGDGSAEVLDAGCGTGLCAPLLLPYARRLVGVDLSAGMLTKAQARGLYHELAKAELTAYLEAHPGRFDIIVSADTLCYFGDLDRVLAAAAAALRPGGTLVFTVEYAEGNTAGYALQAHGRYSHSRAYVEACLGRAGLIAEIQSAQLRMEGGEPVVGLVVAGTKPASMAAAARGGPGASPGAD